MYKCLNPYESDTKTFKNVSYFKNIYKRLLRVKHTYKKVLMSSSGPVSGL